jgi:hypothetical protein
MSSLDEKYPMWFVYDYHVSAGRPKAEAAVFEYAREKYLYRLIAEELLSKEVIPDLVRYCDKVLAENKRLAPVEISLGAGRCPLKDGHAWIYIGQQSLHIRKVIETIE